MIKDVIKIFGKHHTYITITKGNNLDEDNIFTNITTLRWIDNRPPSLKNPYTFLIRIKQKRLVNITVVLDESVCPIVNIINLRMVTGTSIHLSKCQITLCGSLSSVDSSQLRYPVLCRLFKFEYGYWTYILDESLLTPFF